jgi:hypothetical protein
MLSSRTLLLLCAGTLPVGCAAEVQDEPLPAAIFPLDFEAHYAEMRSCRHSHEHELRFIRVFASESAATPYATLSAEAPYPPGAILVKAEYDDGLCEEVLGFTAMQKLVEGENPDGGDWRWQKLDADLELLEDGAPLRCVSCHAQHCAPPHGFDLSCAEEI